MSEENNIDIEEPKESLVQMWKEMIYDVYAYRELLWEMFLRDIRVRYKQAVMGYFWAVFIPIMVVFSGFVIKIAMATMSGNNASLTDVSYFATMSVKAVAWSFFIGATVSASNSLVGNVGLITKIYFPREVFPMSCFCSNFFDSAIGAGTLFIVMACIGAIDWTFNLLWVPVLIALLIILGLAISMFLSCAMVFYRDVRYILNVITTFGIFYTPVFYEPNLLGNKLGTIIMLNPVSPLLEGLRLVIVNGHNLFVPLVDANNIIVWQPWYLGYAAVFSVVALFFSWMHFHKMEFLYAEYI